MTTLLFLDDERVVEDVTWVKYPEYDDFMEIHNPEISVTMTKKEWSIILWYLNGLKQPEVVKLIEELAQNNAQPLE